MKAARLFEPGRLDLMEVPVFYVSGLDDDLPSGLVRARERIDSGKALAKLAQWVETQNRKPAEGAGRLRSLLASLPSNQ